MTRRLIQDIFTDNIVPSITAQFKNICYVTDDEGNVMLSDLGQLLLFPPDQNNWSLKFHHSSKTEWLTYLRSLIGSGDENMTYPFMFLNANGVTYSSDRKTVNIADLVFVNVSDVKYDAKNKDDYSMKPILWNLVEFFINAIKDNGNEVSFTQMNNQDYKISPIYSYGTIEMQGDSKHDTYNSAIDAIQITNLNLKISKTCKK